MKRKRRRRYAAKHNKSGANLPMEQRILDVLANRGGTLPLRLIAQHAHVSNKDRHRLAESLRRMTADGHLTCQSGFYAFAWKRKPLEGVVSGVHGKFGFVHCDALERDVFIPGRYLRCALPGDSVTFLHHPDPERDTDEGVILAITQEADYTFTGTYQRRQGVGRVLPDNGLKTPLAVKNDEALDIQDGSRVAARVARRAAYYHNIVVEIVENAGPPEDIRACCLIVAAAAGASTRFSEGLSRAAERIAREGADKLSGEGRLDLRDRPIFTIDGAGSKDLDDAVSLRTLDGEGWELGVHIADVSHYVQPGELDSEAYERGTSIYYGDQVIPMLPEPLSNGICSLNPGEDRLALSVFITLDAHGAMQAYHFEKSVIRSCVRGVYDEVNALLAGSADEAVRNKYAGVSAQLKEMQKLAGQLRANRMGNGAVDLDSVESEFIFDGDGGVCGVRPRSAGVSEHIIEEFMLMANQAAARFGTEREIPFIYRVHESPPEEKADALFDMLARLGIEAQRPIGELRTESLRAIQDAVRGGEWQAVVNKLILRAMAKARYSDENLGHYGLALPLYTHFTSPIRRYPDLAIHRIISAALEGASSADIQKRFSVYAHEAAVNSSACETRAMNVERQCDSMFKAQAMTRHVGTFFDGVISGVTTHGFYVLLPNTVEGLVPIDSLEMDTYECDGAVTLTGVRSKRRFRVGEAVRVQLTRADPVSGFIDFILADSPDEQR